ncbi:hypothetical protein ACS0TY_028205 [Phlomoides rotata]
MANLDDIMEERKVVSDDTENRINGSGLNADENRVILDDGAVVAKGVVETEIVLESIFYDNCVLGLMNREKELFGSLSSAGDVHKNVSGSIVDGVLGSGRWNGEKLEDGDHGFRVGDLVWGKVRSNPWWPGQVYDARDASDFAVKHSQEGRLLVAFFGDGSCSWCLASQLVPFIQNFNQMSRDGPSKSFLNAVQKAVDEVGRLVESRLTCKCIQKKDHLARPVVANSGIKAGVVAPELDIDKQSILEFEPDEILKKVMNFAKVVSVDNALELGFLRSSLSAFYNAKCGYPLPVYNEPVRIEGLEDKNESETAFTSDCSPSIEMPTQGPQDDKTNDGQKQRSVAELMRRGNDNEPKRRKKPANGSSLKRHKTVDGEVEEGRKLEGQKRRVQADSDEKQKKSECDEGKEEFENATSPRERKKSKYLSPPYTNFSWKALSSSFRMKSESDKSSSRSSSPVSKIDDETSDEEELTSQQKWVGGPRKTNGLVLDNAKRLSFSESDLNIPVNELLSEIKFSAIDQFFLSNKGRLDNVQGFVSAFRGSVFVHGEDYRVYQKSIGNESDDLISDVSLIRQKLDTMLSMLEDYCSKISNEGKCRLKDELQHLMEYVETASDKVRLEAENASSFE